MDAPRNAPLLTAVSWAPPQELDFADWAKFGRRLGTIGRGVGWWIGDWLNYGESKYGEHYKRAAQITGYGVQSLRNMAYVAAHVEISRRRENLSFSHHAEVAALPAGEQEDWLDRAAADELSVQSLREELRWERSETDPKRQAPAKTRETDPAPSAEADERVVCPACGHHFT